VLEVKRLTVDYDAPDARPALILAAAPSLRGLMLHLDSRTYVPLRRACADTFSISAPSTPQRCKRDPIRLRLASCTSATASTRSSALDTLGTIRTTSYPPPAPCVSATPSARSSPLIGASLAWLAAPLLLPASHCPRHPPPPSWRIIKFRAIPRVCTWSHEAAHACARRRVHHGRLRRAPPSCLVLCRPCANSRYISRSACVSRAIFAYCMLIPHLP
jgi:hypothetical protein